jgi:hypothetical protein
MLKLLPLLGMVSVSGPTLEEKCPSTTTGTFGRCWRPPSTMILVGFMVDWKTFFLVSDALYCHGLGQIMVDGPPARGRCWFFDFAFDFGLWPTFSGCRAVMSVYLADLFFHSRYLAHIAWYNSLWSGPWVPDVSLSVRLTVPHDCWLLVFIFQNRSPL